MANIKGDDMAEADEDPHGTIPPSIPLQSAEVLYWTASIFR